MLINYVDGYDFIESEATPPPMSLCAICKEPPSAPCILSGCGHIYCRLCASMWTALVASCPLCKAPCRRVFLRQEESTEKLRCPVQGCYRSVQRRHWNTHARRHELRQCSNEGCNRLVQGHLMKEHRSQHCQYEKVCCPMDGCPQLVPYWMFREAGLQSLQRDHGCESVSICGLCEPPSYHSSPSELGRHHGLVHPQQSCRGYQKRRRSRRLQERDSNRRRRSYSPL